MKDSMRTVHKREKGKSNEKSSVCVIDWSLLLVSGSEREERSDSAAAAAITILEATRFRRRRERRKKKKHKARKLYEHAVNRAEKLAPSFSLCTQKEEREREQEINRDSAEDKATAAHKKRVRATNSSSQQSLESRD